MSNDLSGKLEDLRVICHPLRISILNVLTGGVKCVTDLQEFLDVKQPVISLHLAALRRSGIIDFFIDGRLRCYFLKNPIIPDVLDMLERDYPKSLPEPECCPITDHADNAEGDKQD